VRSESFETHMEHISYTLNRLKQYGMTINITKSKLFRKEIPFLGHILSNTSIKKDESKVEAIVKFPRPKNIKQLRSFLGLTNFYNQNMEGHRQKCMSLYKLEKKINVGIGEI